MLEYGKSIKEKGKNGGVVDMSYRRLAARARAADDATHGGLALRHADLGRLATLVPAAPRPSRDPPTTSAAADLETILFAKRPDA